MSSKSPSYADEIAKLWDVELIALYRQIRHQDPEHARICEVELKRRGVTA